jgi:hypothetical protein
MVPGTHLRASSPGRSFTSLVLAHLAVTLVVCGGFVLLLPTPAMSQGLPATISIVPLTDCDGSGYSTTSHQLTGDDAELSAPDSDDDDDDDDAPTGSDVAIAADDCRTVSHGHVMEVVHMAAEPCISRTVDGHSLRGPPAGEKTDSDTDVDTDGDDDPCAEYAELLPPASHHQLWTLTLADFVRISSTRTRHLSLRAPPLSIS